MYLCKHYSYILEKTLSKYMVEGFSFFFYILLLVFNDSVSASLTDNYSHFSRGILTHVSDIHKNEESLKHLCYSIRRMSLALSPLFLRSYSGFCDYPVLKQFRMY